MGDRAVLPVRFGTVLAGEAAVHDVLKAHYPDFVAALDRVRGRVELGVRILNSRLPIFDSMASSRQSKTENRKSKIGSGRSYLLARLEEERQLQARRRHAEALAAELHAPLNRLAAESTRQVLLTPRMLLTAAYLVEQDQVEAFRREVEALGAAHPTLQFLCTGPWPAYSFVTETVPDVGAISPSDHPPQENENASLRPG